MFSLAINGIWAVTTVGKIVVAALSLRALRGHPGFAAYCWASLSITLGLWYFSLHGLTVQYFWLYYAGNLFKDALMVGALYEVMAPVIFPLWVIPRETRVLATSLLAVTSICSVSGSLVFSSEAPQQVIAVARTADKAVTLVFFLAIAAALGICARLQIPWPRLPLYIAAGFVVYLFVDSAVFVALTKAALLDHVQGIHLAGYLLAEALWAIGLVFEDDSIAKLSDLEVRDCYRRFHMIPREKGVLQ